MSNRRRPEGLCHVGYCTFCQHHWHSCNSVTRMKKSDNGYHIFCGWAVAYRFYFLKKIKENKQTKKNPHKIIFAFPVIFQHWVGIGCWNPSPFEKSDPFIMCSISRLLLTCRRKKLGHQQQCHRLIISFTYLVFPEYFGLSPKRFNFATIIVLARLLSTYLQWLWKNRQRGTIE